MRCHVCFNFASERTTKSSEIELIPRRLVLIEPLNDVDLLGSPSAFWITAWSFETFHQDIEKVLQCVRSEE